MEKTVATPEQVYRAIAQMDRAQRILESDRNESCG